MAITFLFTACFAPLGHVVLKRRVSRHYAKFLSDLPPFNFLSLMACENKIILKANMVHTVFSHSILKQSSQTAMHIFFVSHNHWDWLKEIFCVTHLWRQALSWTLLWVISRTKLDCSFQITCGLWKFCCFILAFWRPLCCSDAFVAFLHG